MSYEVGLLHIVLWCYMIFAIAFPTSINSFVHLIRVSSLGLLEVEREKSEHIIENFWSQRQLENVGGLIVPRR